MIFKLFSGKVVQDERLKALFNSVLQGFLGKKRQECSTLELPSIANLVIPNRWPCINLATCYKKFVL